jgi:LPS sulfotransferase NodH
MTRHLIVTHPRSGSNHLVDALNSHPRLFNYGEVLGRWSRKRRVYDAVFAGRRDLGWYVEQFYVSRTWFHAAQAARRLATLGNGRQARLRPFGTIASIGIKDFHPLIRASGLEDVFLHEPRLRVIYLHRRDLLKRYVSWLLARGGGGRLTPVDAGGRRRARIDVEAAVTDLGAWQERQAVSAAWVSSLPAERVHVLAYEDYLQSPETARRHHRDLCRFLGVEPLDLRSRHVKQAHDEPSSLIVNYDELARRVGGTRLERHVPRRGLEAI